MSDVLLKQAKTHIQLDDEMEDEQDLSLLHRKYVRLEDAQKEIQRQRIEFTNKITEIQTEQIKLEGRLKQAQLTLFGKKGLTEKLQELINILALPNMGDEGRKAKLVNIKTWQIQFLEQLNGLLGVLSGGSAKFGMTEIAKDTQGNDDVVSHPVGRDSRSLSTRDSRESAQEPNCFYCEYIEPISTKTTDVTGLCTKKKRRVDLESAGCPNFKSIKESQPKTEDSK